MCSNNSQSLCYVSGSFSKRIVGFFLASPYQHFRNTFYWLYCPDENSMRHIFTVRYHIKKMMNSITKINIGHPAMCIHYLSPVCSSPTKCMRSSVYYSIICLQFYNPPGSNFTIPVCDKYFSKKLLCNL